MQHMNKSCMIATIILAFEFTELQKGLIQTLGTYLTKTYT